MAEAVPALCGVVPHHRINPCGHKKGVHHTNDEQGSEMRAQGADVQEQGRRSGRLANVRGRATGRGSIGNQARARLPITSLEVLCTRVRGACV